jgi:hypothetical protein
VGQCAARKTAAVISAGRCAQLFSRDMTRLTIYFLILLLWTSCGKRTTKITDDSTTIDTTKAVRIANFWTVPKESFGFYQSNASRSSRHDTLVFPTCSEYVYSPFGQMRTKLDIPKSGLKNFKVKDRTDKQDNGDFEFQILELNSNKLILFFDTTSHVRSTYVFKGEINDNEAVFVDNVKIGMSKEDFINTFFDHFPADKLANYNTIILEPCVEDTKHVYSFVDNKLKRVEFKSVSYWTVNY